MLGGPTYMHASIPVHGEAQAWHIFPMTHAVHYRYSTPQVPFPFSSREAFEGSRRHPLGTDFNTLDSHKWVPVLLHACHPQLCPPHAASLLSARPHRIGHMSLKC